MTLLSNTEIRMERRAIERRLAVLERNSRNPKLARVGRQGHQMAMARCERRLNELDAMVHNANRRDEGRRLMTLEDVAGLLPERGLIIL